MPPALRQTTARARSRFPHVRRAALPLALLLLAAGCRPERPAPLPDEARDPDSSSGEAAVCLRGAPFVASGPVPVEAAPAEGGAAEAVSGLRWRAHEGCERFVIDFDAGDAGALAAPGTVRAELLRELGVVRISLPDVDQVRRDATEAELGGELARAAYSVRSRDGRGVYVDLHLGGEAEAHVAILRDPARVLVDLRPAGGPVAPPPASVRQVVVLRPRTGPASYPLRVTGYARTFEANVVARLERGGREVHESFTTATDWMDAWGHFEMTIDEGPSGAVVLHVGEYSARDGTWEGARVELEMR